jgi:hypothetical protein
MRFCLLLLAVVLPLSAAAQGFGALRWDYVAASMVTTELDEFGYEIKGSTAVTDHLVVFGAWLEFEPNEHIDRQLLTIGVGRVWNFRPNMDFMMSAIYGDNEIVESGIELEEEGVIVGFEVRGWATGRVELNGAVQLDNSAGSNTDIVLEFGAEFFRRRNVSYGGRIRSDDYETTVVAGLRYYFGASRR